MKVSIWPTTTLLPVNNGIGRVVQAQHVGLPKLGIEIVDPDHADVIACHTQQADLPRVDVLHCHGAYWNGDPGSGNYKNWHHRANAEIVKAARRAHFITVPSNWVGQVFRRDMRIDPVVIGHGINFDEWEPGTPDGYILWNKNRNGDVCDPTPAWELAKQGFNVISTFGPERPYLPSLKITGPLSEDMMRPLIRNCQIYLATTKETFGIGTLEAMACGVPVLGFRHGGTAQLVTHGENGYLVDPYDYAALGVGVHYIEKHWPELSANARAIARQYDWESVMLQYADVYERAYQNAQEEIPQTTIVITAHNYGQFVGEAIQSALDQTMPCHVIVVDDGSDDDTLMQARKFTGRIDKIISQPNQGVAAARNVGIAAAETDFIICLDADDVLDPRYVEVLQTEMATDRGLGIAYTGLATIREGRIVPNDWPPDFKWEGMARPGNPPPSCIHCAAMFRKRMWERAGGYRQEFAPAEDTEFWVRGLAVGFTAKKVTPDMLFHYRLHSNSASRVKEYHPISDGLPWMADQQFPFAAPSSRPPLVRSYSNPAISVIIPVGSSHWKYVPRALESLLSQSVREWEVIVVRDGDDPDMKAILAPYPFVRLVEGDGRGPGRARNIGLDHAVAAMCLFLDADDYLAPEALKNMSAAYSRQNGRYIYTDWVAVHKDEQLAQSCPDYDVNAILKVNQHAVTVLMATDAARKIRFSESLTVLEDWEFFIRCAIEGVTGYHLAEPLLYARTESGSRTKSRVKYQKVVDKIYDSYEDYREGKKTLMGCCGNDNKAALAAAALVQKQGLTLPSGEFDMPNFNPEQGEVRLVFIGINTGSIPYGGPGVTPSGRVYRGADNIFDKYVNADPRDVPWLLGLGVWKVVPSVPMAAPILPTVREEAPQPAMTVEIRPPNGSTEQDAMKMRPGDVVQEGLYDTADDELFPGETPTPLLDQFEQNLNVVKEAEVEVTPEDVDNANKLSEAQALAEIERSIRTAPPGKGRRQR